MDTSRPSLALLSTTQSSSDDDRQHGHGLDLAIAQSTCVAPLDSVLTAAAADGSAIVAGDAFANAHVLALMQGDPTTRLLSTPQRSSVPPK